MQGITPLAPLIAPYVRVSYTALHLYDNFRLTQIVIKGIDQTRSISYSFTQKFGTNNIINYMTASLAIKSASRVCHRKDLFIRKLATK